VACRFLELVPAIHVVVDGGTTVAIVHATSFFCHAFFNLCFWHYCSYGLFCLLVFFPLFVCFVFPGLELSVAS
jgi:hypothetical protein